MSVYDPNVGRPSDPGSASCGVPGSGDSMAIPPLWPLPSSSAPPAAPAPITTLRTLNAGSFPSLSRTERSRFMCMSTSPARSAIMSER